MGVGDVEVDLSAAVWSLQYNLGPVRLGFLKAYGRPDATEHDVERLRAVRDERRSAGRSRGGSYDLASRATRSHAESFDR